MPPARFRHSLGSTLPVTIDVATLLTVGWRTAADSGDLHYFSLVVFVAAFAVLVRTVLVEFRSSCRSVVILGSGALAAKVIEEIDSGVDSRYIVAGIVDDEQPRQGWAARVKWLGRSDQLAAIVDQVHPSTILVAVADRRRHLPLQ